MSSTCGIIPDIKEEYSISRRLRASKATRSLPGAVKLSFKDWRASIDRRVLSVFNNKQLKRALSESAKVQLDELWALTVKILETEHRPSPASSAGALQFDIHQLLIEGLPGEALYIAASMVFDSMQEALPFFEISAKTARAKVGDTLSSGQGEIALRLGRLLTMAWNCFGSLDIARQYLRTPNFALGGAIPRDLLKTGEGEQMVVTELQTQAAGGPV